jgi:hypothetical protein
VDLQTQNIERYFLLFTSAHLDIQRVPAAIAREQAGFSTSRSEPSRTRKRHQKDHPRTKTNAAQ